LLIQSHNRGYTVAPPLSATDYGHLYQTRRALELAAIAAAELDPATTEEIARTSREMAATPPGMSYDSYSQFSQSDHQFHLAIVRSAHNPFLEFAWTGLHFHLHVARLYEGAGVIDFADAIREHEQLVDALERGDRREAARVLRIHTVTSERRLRQLMSRSD